MPCLVPSFLYQRGGGKLNSRCGGDIGYGLLADLPSDGLNVNCKSQSSQAQNPCAAGRSG